MAGMQRGLSVVTMLLVGMAATSPAFTQTLMSPDMPKVTPQQGFTQQDDVRAKDLPASPQKVRITGNRSIYSEEEVERAIAVLRAHCQPLGGMQWEDLTDITARITPEYAPYRQEKGWKTAIHLTAVISQKPRFIPAEEPRMGVFAGRTLYFFIGGASAPGIFVSRQIGKYLCGLPGYESGDIEFLPAPELDFLNR